MKCDCCGVEEATHTTTRMAGDSRSTCDHCYKNCIVGKPCTKTEELMEKQEEKSPTSPPKPTPKVPESLSEWF